MQRLAWIPVLLACLLAGCGGNESSGPLDASLSYIPKGTPFAVAIDTDLEGEQWKDVDSILERFPVGVDVDSLLGSQLGGDGVDFERDIKPLLGNPFVVSAASVDSFSGGGGDDFVAAIQVEDEDKLDSLIEKTGSKERGEAGGATIYDDGDTVYGVDGDIVIFADSAELVEQAAERADGDEHLDEETFDSGLEGLPENGLARVYANLQALLAGDPDTREARTIEWVGALRTLGLTASVTDDEVAIDFVARTEGADLADDDLPIAAGDEAPPIVENRGEIGLGIRDPAQVVQFAERAAQAVDPQGFGQYALAKKTLDAQLGISIDDDLIGALTGDVSGSFGLDGRFGARAELKDPEAFERTLAKVAPALPPLLRGAGSGPVTLKKPGARGGLYVLREAHGDDYFFGVVDGRFVVASDRARAARLATEDPTSVPDAEGAVVIGADGAQLANEFLRLSGFTTGLDAFGARLFTGALGDVTGSVAAEPDGVHGSFKVELD
jgi:hypothetical protein